MCDSCSEHKHVQTMCGECTGTASCTCKYCREKGSCHGCVVHGDPHIDTQPRPEFRTNRKHKKYPKRNGSGYDAAGNRSYKIFAWNVG